MAYLFIEDFKFGMDRRRERVAGTPGTLWTGKNVQITRGGDIQRTKKFVSRFTLPAGSHGLVSLGEQLYVFDDTDLSATIPAGVGFQRLQAPSAPSMTRIVDAKVFQGKIYAIAEYDDGNVYHFYDGSRVTDWDTVADSIASLEILAQYLAAKISENSAVDADANGTTILVTASTPGTDFTIAKSTTNEGGGTADQDITLTEEQANVAAVSETRATGTVTVTGGYSLPGQNVISDITVNGVSLFASAVNYSSSHSATAAAIVTEINNNTATHGYSAVSTGAAVTITAAAGTGATPNGYVVATSIPAESAVTASTANMASGVTAVAAVAKVVSAVISGTLDTQDLFTITVNGTDYGATPRGAATGNSLYVHRGRVYSTVSSLVQYCQINDPTDWTTTASASDAGFINISSDNGGAELLIGMEDYNDLTAIFSEDNVYVYSLSADNSNNAKVSVLRNTGTRSRHSIVAYGNRDVFYLDASGVRSIQARDSSGDASVDDIGTVIDTFVQEYVATLDESKVPRAVSVIEPTDNLFMLLLGGRIFVLSRYPKVKISAWTYIERDETFTHLARTPRRLYARDEDTIYLYGGPSGTEYDDADTAVPLVELPFMSAKDEAGVKMLSGYDMGCVGTWSVKALVDPNNEASEINVGAFYKTTFAESHAALPSRTTHVALKLTGLSAGKSKIPNAAIHFEREERR